MLRSGFQSVSLFVKQHDKPDLLRIWDGIYRHLFFLNHTDPWIAYQIWISTCTKNIISIATLTSYKFLIGPPIIFLLVYLFFYFAFILSEITLHETLMALLEIWLWLLYFIDIKVV
jgi:hypothetical protein